MTALVRVTDSLSGEPVIINADQVVMMRRRDETTLIEFDRNILKVTETPKTIVNAVLAQIPLSR